MDYFVPVNLDIGTLEAEFVEEDDPHVNRLGVKGVGEIALVGVAPAIDRRDNSPNAQTHFSI